MKKEIASRETLNIENSEMDLTISAHTGMLEVNIIISIAQYIH